MTLARMHVPWKWTRSKIGLLKLAALAFGVFAVIHSTPDLIRELKLYRM